MRRLLGLKDSTNMHSSAGTKGKERQRDYISASLSLPDPSSSHTPMEVHVSTEVHSAADSQGFHPLASSTSLASPSPASSDSRPLPLEIDIPTHPYPYWQGHAHTPSSSSQGSLELPITPSHVSWPTIGNTPGNPNHSENHSSVNLNSTNTASAPPSPAGPGHSLLQLRSSPSPHFPPPPPTNPPPNISARPKLLHPTKSSHSLRIPLQESFNQQLSPIVEQDYFSPELRPVSLPSSSHEGRSSTALTVRTSIAMMTPVSPWSDNRTGTVTPVALPITPILVGARGSPPTPQTSQAQTPATPSYPGGTVPFARRREEEGNDSPRPSPSPVSTFILRPLNRSISLSSTRTHQSSASSVTPPVIPPLDLKPEFKGPVFLTSPTSHHARGLLEIGGRDDDTVSDKRDSFVTARTGAGRESKYSFGQSEVFVDAEEGYIRDSDGTIHPFDSRLLDDTTDSPPSPQVPPLPQISENVKPPVPARTVLHLRSTSSSPPSYKCPPGQYSSESQTHPNFQFLHPSSPTSHPSRLGVSAPSLQDLGTSISASSSFVDRRFAASSLYLRPSSGRESDLEPSSKWRRRLGRVDIIQVLFWLGFIAPWCWLIGGWLMTSHSKPSRKHGYGNGYHRGPGGGGSSHLPLWTSKSMHSFDTTKMQHGYPFVAPSVLSLTPPLPPYQSQQMAVALTPKPIGKASSPWVRRCRIAAVISGVLIVLSLVVAIVVIGTGHARWHA